MPAGVKWMEVIVMRHGERDYEPCHERGFIGQGLELAPSTEKGEKHAEEAAWNPLIVLCLRLTQGACKRPQSYPE